MLNAMTFILLCSVLLFWMLLCWVSFCWVSLYWVSWNHLKGHVSPRCCDGATTFSRMTTTITTFSFLKKILIFALNFKFYPTVHSLKYNLTYAGSFRFSQYAERCYTDCHKLLLGWVSLCWLSFVIMLMIIMLSVIILIFIMYFAFILNIGSDISIKRLKRKT